MPSSPSLPSSQSPLSDLLPKAPIQALINSHLLTLAKCAGLLALAEHVETHGSDTQAQAGARGFLHYFDTQARTTRENEEQNVFPALIESMAGSDAVCLRGMTEGLTDMLHELDRHWRTQLRPPLLSLAEGKPAELPAAALHAFCDSYAAYIERANSELLPMAERLLTDPEIALLGQAMYRRRNT